MPGFIIIIVLFIAFFIIFYYAEKKRQEKLAATAQSMGMEFQKEDTDKAFLELVKTFQIGQTGRSRRVTNIMQASVGGMRTFIMDYYYQIGGGKSSSRKDQTLIILEQTDWQWPEFILRPEHFGDKIKSKVGKDDIDFDDSPEFSKRYYLIGAEEENIRQYFSKDMRTYFEANLHWHIETQPGRILICRQGRRQKPEEIIVLLKEALAIKDTLISKI